MSKDGSPDSNGRHASPPTKIDKLRYAGYSAEFLDRVEPNGNIPDRCAPGRNIPDRCGPGRNIPHRSGPSPDIVGRSQADLV